MFFCASKVVVFLYKFNLFCVEWLVLKEGLLFIAWWYETG